MASSGGGDRCVWLLVVLLILPTAFADLIAPENGNNSVRWVTSEFGECSVECGDGIKERTARCVRTQIWGDKIEDTDVLISLCPQPSPALTQTCDGDKCEGRWVVGEWSQCSETCGTGTQTRSVKCKGSNVTVRTQRGQAMDPECQGVQPESTQTCHITDCPELDQEPAILAENYTLIQLNRAKKITVNVGGEVNLFPGQTVEVRCPVKHYLIDLVYWSKGYRLIPFMGRVRNVPGGLVIDKAEPSLDAGVYTCTAGDLTATVTVQFLNKDDPLTKKYKEVIRKSKREHRTRALKETNGGQNNKSGGVPLGTEEQNQQRDQSKKSTTNFRMYALSEWSPCNATCGSPGHQVRDASCVHVTQKYVKVVPELECSDLGLEIPEVERPCSTEKNCGVWRSGPWSQCHPSCGPVGQMTRILICDWQSTGQPALEVCNMKSKPLAWKACTPRPCPLACIDESMYCSLASILKLCRYQQFRQACCNTCQALPSD